MRNLKDMIRSGGPVAPESEPPHETCLSCGADLSESRTYARYRVCHSCGFHFHLGGRERTALLLDPASFREADRGVTNIDPISFSTERQPYRSRVIRTQRRTGLTEAALTGMGTIFGHDVVVVVLDFSFLGGSIGVAAGERLARAFEKATTRQAPVISVCSTAGTRMQEGILALMQVPRVVAAAQRHSHAGLAHICVLTDPTTGSAYSGFVNIADYIIAEPNALVGYAALRAVEEQSDQVLRTGSHTSERHLELGLIDAVVPREQLRDSIALLLDLLRAEMQLSAVPGRRQRRIRHTPHSALQQVQLSRHSNRPTASDFITRMAPFFVALRGDRSGFDDPAIIAGLAAPGGEPLVFIGQERTHGDPKAAFITPAGFRKATRAMRLAGKFGLPVVTLIDTSGANPGIESEEAGLGPAMAECLATMLDVPAPTVAVITGEGSSEAAVSLAAADRVLMLDNAVYEVVKPEDAARIYRESEAADDLADRLTITSHDCLRLGIADGLVPEPGEGAHTNHDEAAAILRRAILRELARIEETNPKRLRARRYDRYRHMGTTRARMRGTIERRRAHLFDRMGATFDRLRRKSAARRRMEGGESPEIPV